MKPIKTKVLLFAAVAGSFLLSLGAAKAANSQFSPGDLVMYFQQEGSDQTVYVNLGNTATFRGDAAGADVDSIINIININTQLNTAFGANWATEVNLYAGLAGVWGTSQTNSSLQNGDPHRTLYVSQSRNGVGTVGEANSSGYSVATNTGMTTGASGITDNNLPFLNSYEGLAVVSETGVSNIDDQNPFLDPGIQGTAFGIFGGGVQQVGSASSFGSFGSVENVEFALDLYRILARNNVAGQVGGDVRSGSYEGTFTLDSAGNVSFIAVPEPSTYALLGIGSAFIFFMVRRRAKTQATS